jgi:hypothetical protein
LEKITCPDLLKQRSGTGDNGNSDYGLLIGAMTPELMKREKAKCKKAV